MSTCFIKVPLLPQLRHSKFEDNLDAPYHFPSNLNNTKLNIKLKYTLLFSLKISLFIGNNSPKLLYLHRDNIWLSWE